MSDTDGKPTGKNPGQTDPDQTDPGPGQDKRTITKLSVNFYGQGEFEGMTLEQVLKKFPKGSKIKINGVETTIKGG